VQGNDADSEILLKRILESHMSSIHNKDLSPCDHSSAPDWENNLWLLASGELEWEEEKSLTSAIGTCAYCRMQLARCQEAEKRSRQRNPLATTAPANQSQEKAPGLVSLVVERFKDGLRCLQQEWTQRPRTAMALRGTAEALDNTLMLVREVNRLRVEIFLQTTQQQTTRIAISVVSLDMGCAMDGRAELSTHQGSILESIPITEGQGRFQPLSDGIYNINLIDNFGPPEMVEIQLC
jgi:hypothetical protein